MIAAKRPVGKLDAHARQGVDGRLALAVAAGEILGLDDVLRAAARVASSMRGSPPCIPEWLRQRKRRDE